MDKKNRRLISLILCFCLVAQQTGSAQVVAKLDVATHLKQLTSSILPQDHFRPVHLRSLAFDEATDTFKLLLDVGARSPRPGDHEGGETPPLRKGRLQRAEGSTYGRRNTDDGIQEETAKLMRYFHIGLTLPNSMFWVNLRPDAPDNIIEDKLAQTDIGRIMLEADVQLKRDTAAFTSPDTLQGREYWDKLYKKAGELFGTEQVEIPTYTRPWIVPGEIILRETRDDGRGTQDEQRTTNNEQQTSNLSAYVYKATLKVMLEEDYIANVGAGSKPALQGRAGLEPAPTQGGQADPRYKVLNEYSSELIRQLIIPKITLAVNSAKRYAELRQVYYSLILAQWFKDRNRSVVRRPYSVVRPASVVSPPSSLERIDSGNLGGLTSTSAWTKSTYFAAYQKSFKEGEYRKRETAHTPTGQVIRTFTSGGIMPLPATLNSSSAVSIDPRTQEVVTKVVTNRTDSLFAREPYISVGVNQYPLGSWGNIEASSAISKDRSFGRNGGLVSIKNTETEVFTLLDNVVNNLISDDQITNELKRLIAFGLPAIRPLLSKLEAISLGDNRFNYERSLILFSVKEIIKKSPSLEPQIIDLVSLGDVLARAIINDSPGDDLTVEVRRLSYAFLAECAKYLTDPQKALVVNLLKPIFLDINLNPDLADEVNMIRQIFFTMGRAGDLARSVPASSDKISIVLSQQVPKAIERLYEITGKDVLNRNILLGMIEEKPDVVEGLAEISDSSLKPHNLQVLNQFRETFMAQNIVLPSGVSFGFFMLLLALHDIGKPWAGELEQDTTKQNIYTVAIVEQLLRELSFNEGDIKLAKALLGSNLIGEYLEETEELMLREGQKQEDARKLANPKAREVATKLEIQAIGAGIPLADFFYLAIIYYQCDVAGHASLMRLFELTREGYKFDSSLKRLIFSNEGEANYPHPFVSTRFDVLDESVNKRVEFARNPWNRLYAFDEIYRILSDATEPFNRLRLLASIASLTSAQRQRLPTTDTMDIFQGELILRSGSDYSTLPTHSYKPWMELDNFIERYGEYEADDVDEELDNLIKELSGYSVRVHGVAKNRGGIKGLLSIILEGRIREDSSHGETFFAVIDDLKQYGPYYVVIDYDALDRDGLLISEISCVDDLSGEYHKYYLVPGNYERDVLISGLREAADLGLSVRGRVITRDDIDEVIKKIKIYNEGMSIIDKPEGMGDLNPIYAQVKLSVSSPLAEEKRLPIKDNVLNSPTDAQKGDLGGIDLRMASGMVLPAASPLDPAVAGLRPQLGLSARSLLLSQKDLDKEWLEIENMVNNGVIPSCQRMLEYIFSACRSKDCDLRRDKVILCMADILRIQESSVLPTEPVLRDMLLILESDKPAGDLLAALMSLKSPG